jgi:hypothetical protein
MRHERRSKSIDSLREKIETMTSVVKDRRDSVKSNKPSSRALKGFVMLMVWTEQDGTESVSVYGEDNTNQLDLRDALQDWLHSNNPDVEAGFVPSPYLE